MPPPAATQAAARLWTARLVQLRHAAPGEYQPTPYLTVFHVPHSNQEQKIFYALPEHLCNGDTHWHTFHYSTSRTVAYAALYKTEGNTRQ